MVLWKKLLLNVAEIIMEPSTKISQNFAAFITTVFKMFAAQPN